MAVLHLKDSEFQKEVLDTNGLTLVDFWAPWCGPCRMLEATIEELGEEMKEKVKVCKVNVDEEKEYAEKYGIMGIPNVLLFKDGELVESFVGLQDKNTYIDAIERQS